MIAVEQIARLAELFDRYNNALDPFSADCSRAKEQFDNLAAELHSAHAPKIHFPEFRYKLVHECRDYLRKNRP